MPDYGTTGTCRATDRNNMYNTRHLNVELQDRNNIKHLHVELQDITIQYKHLNVALQDRTIYYNHLHVKPQDRTIQYTLVTLQEPFLEFLQMLHYHHASTTVLKRCARFQTYSIFHQREENLSVQWTIYCQSNTKYEKAAVAVKVKLKSEVRVASITSNLADFSE